MQSEDEREMCARTVYCTNIDKKVDILIRDLLFFFFVCIILSGPCSDAHCSSYYALAHMQLFVNKYFSCSFIIINSQLLYSEQVTQADVKNFFETRCGEVSMKFKNLNVGLRSVIERCSYFAGFSPEAFGRSRALDPHCFC